MRNNYPIHRGLVSLLVLVLLSALTFRSQAQSGSVTATQSFSYTGQIVTWTVPTGVTSLTIEARGAEGGDIINRKDPAGKGAIVSAQVNVTPGQSLSILVGQQLSGRGSGGGGSFVVGPGTPNNPTPLVIAGGGGGASTGSGSSDAKHGQLGPEGGGGNGGSNGIGGGSDGSYGGGGLLGDGAGGSGGGKSFINGGAGGDDGSSLGSFGGGASGSAGGAGGYSGGGGNINIYGGGGGSFTAGTRLFARTGATDGNSGNGLVAITYAVPTQPIRYVKPVATGIGDGSSWANASGDLQSQIDIAGAQQVYVAGGTYSTTANSGSFVMKNGVAIYGGFTGSETNLSQRPRVNPVAGQVSSTTLSVSVSRVVIVNNNLTSSAVLDGVVITGGRNSNTAGDGGGMVNTNSSPSLNNCVFSGNTTNNRGGGMANFSSSPSLTNCVFSDNTAYFGGGIYNLSSSPSLVNCVFRGNTATYRGGGILNNLSSPSLVNCVLSDNTASDSGGGIFNISSSNPVLVNCTLTANRAMAGAALVNYSGSQPVLANTILWDNQEAAGTSITNNVNTGVTANYSLIGQGETDFTGSNNLVATTSPFVSSTDFQLTACSVAINAGDPTSTTATNGATDLAGNPRFYQNGRIEMGAYEFQGTPSSAVAITQPPVSGSSVCVGSTVTAMVSVTGTSPAYQWYKDNLTSPVAGQTSATLTLTNVQLGDAGSYSVVVTGSCNAVTSTAFSLTVNAPPAAPTLTNVSRTVTQSDTPLPLNQFVNADNGNTLSFSGVNGPLTPPNANVSQVGAQTFSVTQTNASGCVSAATPFTITVQPRVPTTPTSQTVCRSSRVVLSAPTTGRSADGVRYEWYKNGTSAPFKLTEIASIQRGTTTSSLTLVSVQTTASYYVKVFAANSASTPGSVTVEGPFVVTINYGCTAPSARQAALDGATPAEWTEAGLQIRLLPNPLTDGRLRAVVQGAEGQPLTLELLDLRGMILHQQQWETAAPGQAVDWDVSGQPAGVYLLRAVSQQASGASQRQTLKVLKPD